MNINNGPISRKVTCLLGIVFADLPGLWTKTMALISLEDLDGLEDEELDNDITDNPEPMEDDEQQRLYTHWQAIASTHQVSVPRGKRDRRWSKIVPFEVVAWQQCIWRQSV